MPLSFWCDFHPGGRLSATIYIETDDETWWGQELPLLLTEQEASLGD